MNKKILSLLLIVSLSFSTMLTAEENKFSKVLNKGQELLFQGKYADALKVLKAAAKEHPESSSVLLYLARAYSFNNELVKAEEPLKKILKKQADHIEAGQLLAQVYNRQKKYKELVEVLEPLLEFRHDYPNYQLLAQATYKLDRMKDSQKYYEEAIKLNNKNPQDHYNLGNIHLLNLEYAKAANSYNQAMNLKMNTPELHFKLATVYFNLRNYFGQISQIKVPSGKEKSIFGQWYLIEKKSDDFFLAAPAKSAIYHVTKVINTELGKEFSVKLLKANIYLSGRRYLQAKKLFGDLKDSVPKEEKALYYFYFSQACLGDYDFKGYLENLKKAIELNPKNYETSLVDAYLLVAGHHRQNGEMKNTIEYMKKALQESPKNSGLHLQLATDYEEIEMLKDASRHWHMVLALESDHPKRVDIINLIEKYRNKL